MVSPLYYRVFGLDIPKFFELNSFYRKFFRKTHLLTKCKNIKNLTDQHVTPTTIFFLPTKYSIKHCVVDPYLTNKFPRFLTLWHKYLFIWIFVKTFFYSYKDSCYLVSSTSRMIEELKMSLNTILKITKKKTLASYLLKKNVKDFYCKKIM